MNCIYLCLLFLFGSCGIFSKFSDNLLKDNGSKNSSADQLASLSNYYLSSPNVKNIKISNKLIRYLENIYNNIIMNNKALLKKGGRPKFYFIRNPIPFHFSLTSNQFFFSTGLLKKYVKNEDLFISVLSYEIIRSNRNIYIDKLIVPVGYIDLERILSITRIPLELEIKVQKWNYFVLKNAKYDSSAILNYIQIKNRSGLDFLLYTGDSTRTSKVEYLFKNFIIKYNPNIDYNRSIKRKGQSKLFYSLLRELS